MSNTDTDTSAAANSQGDAQYFQRMFGAACQALGDVDDALGLPQDGCNNPAATVRRIEQVKTFMSADSAAELRRAVRAMTAMLDGGEWAEHVSADPDAQDLECCITDLVGDHGAMRDVLQQIAAGEGNAQELARQALADLANDGTAA